MALARHPRKGKSLMGPFPAADGYHVSSRALKVRILSGSLSDTVKGPCTGTVGVWSVGNNVWAVPPMVLDMVVDGSTFYYPGTCPVSMRVDARACAVQNPTRDRRGGPHACMDVLKTLTLNGVQSHRYFKLHSRRRVRSGIHQAGSPDRALRCATNPTSSTSPTSPTSRSRSYVFLAFIGHDDRFTCFSV